MSQQCGEESTALTNSNEPANKLPRSKTANYNQLPHWMQDNEYIQAGYRWWALHSILSFLSESPERTR